MFANNYVSFFYIIILFYHLYGAFIVARLSGSTAEFLSMWAHMMAGPCPFLVDEQTGKLTLSIAPVLPGWMFTEEDIVSFTFLGAVQVTYHNPARVDTWKATPKSLLVTDTSGHSEKVYGSVLQDPYATRIRGLDVKSIEVMF